ncbi:PhnD/SsuA/transferrin family substrate-binding protein [Superficieibacter sp. HKU1]|uniref:phosphate/phosphite/phosphonate ABC transporter substrate-binding protein n=1 Tax=Superficieibacter sp. HKU1 TaxID=3031919 RepID=UPI0023E34819|nr:PhnD/SsuA/transferrin family substrate-binding protein [Superficieibacter sp. HKU1]WES66466.1 PhnD/SsuA/transferrin family substrate-binding protein [Superficieibacter sp. HKU1]
MQQTISLPMYRPQSHETRALLQAIQLLLAERNIVARLAFPAADLLAHWRGSDVLLSQTCGFPLMTALPDVQVVGGFHYSAPGCEGVNYRSALVVRLEDQNKTLADFFGRRAACNAVDSQSGFNALRKMVTPLAQEGAFFSQVVISGSHRQSLVEIVNQRADLAAIDCVTLALLRRDEPQRMRELAVIGYTPSTPGLPLITAAQTPRETVQGLREVLHTLVTSARYAERCASTLISGFSTLPREAYRVLLS